VTVNSELLAVTDEEGGIMLLDTNVSGAQSVVQGNVLIQLIYVCTVLANCLSSTDTVIGPILWGHSGHLCHASSLSSSWTSMRACDSSDTW